MWLAVLNNGDHPTTKNYNRLLMQIANDKENLSGLLSQEICERMEAIENKETELRIMEEYTAFSKGFRLGAKIMLDILGDFSIEKAEIQ